MESQGVPYFESHTRTETLIVCSALGHLYGVASKSQAGRSSFPIWDFRWAALPEIDKMAARQARWIRAIASIATKIDRYVNACDFDIEGSVIGDTVLRYACGGVQTRALRMKFSTMTERELRFAFRNLDPGLQRGLVDAGKSRHELDWLYGINLSRTMTESSLKQRAGYTTLSTGRVQGPTLGFVVSREKEISSFVPIPYWVIDATLSHEGKIYAAVYEKERIHSLAGATAISDDCRNATLTVSNLDSSRIRQSPPYPFDLSSLQSEAYRHFGFSPARTLALAEKLYLDALISYPRTSSQKLPPDIGYSEILHGLSARPDYRSLISKLTVRGSLRPNNGPSDDPAHPAIYPTTESSRKSVVGPEGRVYDLIARRFMATFAEPSFKTISRIVLAFHDHKFFLVGSSIVDLGWIEFYRPFVSDDSQPLPDLKIGEMIRVHEIKTVEKFTEPPYRYNPSSLLKKMETANIGTKATRAGIIDLLYKRGYVRDERMRASDLAYALVDLLIQYCPLVVDSDFTADLEGSMNKIQSGNLSRRLMLVEALEHLRPVMLSLLEREEEIGSHLSSAILAQRLADATFASPCPKCGQKLSVVRSRGSGKRFVGCGGKWLNGCDFTLPLPQFGTLTLLSQRCKACGFQMIQARSKGRRPLVSCPRCYATKRRDAIASTRVSTVGTASA